MDMGSLDNKHFVEFMQFISKCTMDEWKNQSNTINSGSTTLTVNHLELVTACILYQILWGLAYLHYEHSIHRDIKLGNVLINSSGVVKLSDFGISRILDSTTAMSHTAVGTSRYMSPER